jgi:type I restriction enzyme S subunit
MSGGLISLNSVVTIDSDHAASVSSSCWAKPGDVIFSIVGTLGLTAIVDEQTTGVMSRGIAKVKSKILPNYYLKAFFKTNYFQSQLERHSVGSVQRGVYLSALEQIIVPVFDAQTHEQLAMKEKLADDMFRTSNSLTQAAKLLVEALIEGQLDEYQLIAAEQALQSGNDLPDRQILNRIKTDGVDGQGQALFSDLDQLYSLLEQANHS